MTTRHLPYAAVLLCVLWIISAMACTRNLKEQEFKNAQARVDMLIAGNASAYKDSIRGAIIQNYRDRANIRVVNVDKLGKIEPGDYQVILIMDTCRAWTRFNTEVKAFLENPEAAGRVVWFMTVDDTDEKYEHGGVDAITAASVVTNEKRVIARLTQQIDAILSH